MENVAVDLGYGFVKAVSSSGKRIVFPAIVGKGAEHNINRVFGNVSNDETNMHVVYSGEQYFVGDLAYKSKGPSRIFQQERYNHEYTKILLNTALQLVTSNNGGSVNVITGLPLDYYQAQAKAFQESILGIQRSLEWKSGPLLKNLGKPNEQDISKQVNVENALVFPQGASAIYSALLNHEGKAIHPHLMKGGARIALIDIGYRTTDYVVVEMEDDGSFNLIGEFSGTVEGGMANIHSSIQDYFKKITGGQDLNESTINRIVKNGSLPHKGKEIDYTAVIQESKHAIATYIADRLNSTWAEESDYFNAIFIAGGGGNVLEGYLQQHFDNRLSNITESQFANAIGYLRLGKGILEQKQLKKTVNE